MKPRRVVASDLPNGGEVIDRAGRGCPESANNHYWLPASSSICSELFAQRNYIELVLRVAWDNPDCTVSEASDARGFLNRVVTLRRHVHVPTRCSLADAIFQGIRKRRGNCCEERRQVRVTAASGKLRRTRIEADDIREELQRVYLDLIGCRRVPPRAQLRIVQSRECVRPDTSLVNAWNKKSEITGMRGMKRPLPKHVGNITERLGQWQLVRERVRFQPSPDFVARHGRRDTKIPDVFAKRPNF